MDMESAAVAFSQEGTEQSSDSRLLIIRTISDPADERKAQLDDLGDEDRGALRKWALLNGIAFLREFLSCIINPSTATFSTSTHLVPKVVGAYRRRPATALQEYDSFFSNFYANETEGLLFDYIALQVEGRHQEPSSMASVVGYAGTGKSAVLSCLYLRQIERYNQNLTTFFPVYVNLRNYTLEKYGSSSQASTAFSHELSQLLQEQSVLVSKNVLLIIDGCDEYYYSGN